MVGVSPAYVPEVHVGKRPSGARASMSIEERLELLEARHDSEDEARRQADARCNRIFAAKLG